MGRKGRVVVVRKISDVDVTRGRRLLRAKGKRGKGRKTEGDMRFSQGRKVAGMKHNREV